MTTRRTVLVIDDDEAVTDYLALKLGARLRVLTLNDPRRALETARRERPDVVVCDREMPGMDGAAVRAALAGAVETAGIPFLVLSANADGPDAVSKQAPAGELLARIDALLG